MVTNVISDLNNASAAEWYRSDTHWFLFIPSEVSVELEACSSTRLQEASLPPPSIYPLHLAACQTAQCHRPSLQTLTNFHFSIFILLALPCLPPLFHIYCLLSLPPSHPPPALRGNNSLCEAFKNRSSWKANSEWHLKAWLRWPERNRKWMEVLERERFSNEGQL